MFKWLVWRSTSPQVMCKKELSIVNKDSKRKNNFGDEFLDFFTPTILTFGTFGWILMQCPNWSDKVINNLPSSSSKLAEKWTNIFEFNYKVAIKNSVKPNFKTIIYVYFRRCHTEIKSDRLRSAELPVKSAK